MIGGGNRVFEVSDNSVNMTLALPQEKVLDIQNKCIQLIASPKATIMKLTKIIRNSRSLFRQCFVVEFSVGEIGNSNPLETRQYDSSLLLRKNGGNVESRTAISNQGNIRLSVSQSNSSYQRVLTKQSEWKPRNYKESDNCNLNPKIFFLDFES